MLIKFGNAKHFLKNFLFGKEEQKKGINMTDKKIYNYFFLKLKITENKMRQEDLCKEINMKQTTLSKKLNNKNNFTQQQITKICKCLNIQKDEIGHYFFTENVCKTQTDGKEQL